MLRINVAVVDDDNDLRDSLRATLASSGRYTCVAACADSHEAMRDIPESRAAMVIMDLGILPLSGIECTALLKRQRVDLKVLVLTGSSADACILQAVQAGADGYLVKPVSCSQVLSALDDLNRGGAPLSPRAASTLVQSLHRESPIPPHFKQLSERELGVLTCLAQGLSTKEIACRMELSYETVRTHLKHLYRKLEVRSRTEALVKFRYGVDHGEERDPSISLDPQQRA